ncbi:MAG: HipA domain-containing protein [Bacilli bacterium]|nr:HipA domain-containing protein [Bacilli bacterium]
MAENKIVYVYEEFFSNEPSLMGELRIQGIRGTEVCSFIYDNAWLRNNRIPRIDPNLEYFSGPQYVDGEKKQFGVFMDSAPDRWGRMLMNRRRLSAGDKTPLRESDYLLGVDDYSRLGAIRFSLEKGGKFISDEKNMSAPPIEKLRDIEYAASEYEKDENFLDEKWISLLLTPGSSLGGARPKANVVDLDGSLWIAKFPSKHDEWDSGLFEYVTYELARLCGLNTMPSKILKFSERGSTFLVKRFDRNGKKRIHFASSMCLLDKTDGESSECSYLDLADFIRSNGCNVEADLVELFKRIVFSILVKNTDDHLRNHGFLLMKNGWVLSPLFDVNPNPDGMYLSMTIDGVDNSLNLDSAIAVSFAFGIDEKTARDIVDETSSIISSSWKTIARRCGASEKAIEYMTPAFGK